MIKKILLIALFIIVVLVLYLVFAKQPQPMPVGSASAARLEQGPHKVVSEKISMIDSSRSMPPDGDFEGADQRSFNLYLWYPEDSLASSQPLVVYSHGFMSNGRGGAYLGEHLASKGYVVASATYPRTHYAASNPNPADVVNQPADVSFIISGLLARNADSNDDLHQKIDPERVAAVGMSLGGMTSKMVSYHPNYADQRITAAVSIAGPSFMFSKRFFQGRDIPFMMIASPVDALIGYPENAEDIREKISNATLVTVENASHTGFSGSSQWLRFFDNPDSIGCNAVKSNIGDEDPTAWYSEIGSAEIGVIQNLNPPLCELDPLPKTINPIRQLQIATLAVESFLQCYMSDQAVIAEQACTYLRSGLANEVPSVSVVY